MLRVHDRLDRCEADSFRGIYRWVRGIRKNCAAEVFRNSRCHNFEERREAIGRAIRQRINFDPERGVSPCDALAVQEDGDRAYRAYLRLRTHDQVIVALRLFEGHTFAEIGKKLRRSAEAVRKSFDRGILKLTDLYLSDGNP
jgi:DNA-directed RNA polymerase specialized sigma24 family protein